VREDNRQIMRLAVDHLLENGHRAIGLLLPRALERWVFERHLAFDHWLRQAGLEAEEGFVHWIEDDALHSTKIDNCRHLERFLQRTRVTAVVSANFHTMDHLLELHMQARINIPDLSVVTIDQHVTVPGGTQGLDLTRVNIPLNEIGQTLADLTLAAAGKKTLPEFLELPASLHVSQSVRRI